MGCCKRDERRDGTNPLLVSIRKYFSPYSDVPKFCRIVGNMTLINRLQFYAFSGDRGQHGYINWAVLIIRSGMNFFALKCSPIPHEQWSQLKDSV